jgi:hypothetical protein
MKGADRGIGSPTQFFTYDATAAGIIGEPLPTLLRLTLSGWRGIPSRQGRSLVSLSLIIRRPL